MAGRKLGREDSGEKSRPSLPCMYAWMITPTRNLQFNKRFMWAVPGSHTAAHGNLQASTVNAWKRKGGNPYPRIRRQRFTDLCWSIRSRSSGYAFWRSWFIVLKLEKRRRCVNGSYSASQCSLLSLWTFVESTVPFLFKRSLQTENQDVRHLVASQNCFMIQYCWCSSKTMYRRAVTFGAMF